MRVIVIFAVVVSCCLAPHIQSSRCTTETNGLWKVEAGIGDLIFSEIADYEVNITTDEDVSLFTSAAVTKDLTPSGRAEGDKPDGRASLASQPASRRPVCATLRLWQAATFVLSRPTVGDTTIIRSVFVPDHQRMGKRVLRIAADAMRIFTARFGPLPLNTMNIAEAPLGRSGSGSTEFAGFDVIASAFYVDFDSPSTGNLPGTHS